MDDLMGSMDHGSSPGQGQASKAEATPRPLVTVVIPNHNYARFLPGCLASLLAQNLDTRTLEVIFVDDASTDGSAELAEALLKDAPLAGHKVLRLGRRVGKPGPVRNFGLARAWGRHLLTLDPDDEISPDYLPRCLDALRRGADVAYTDYYLEEQGQRHEVRLPAFHRLLLANQNVLSTSALFRRELWDRGARFRSATAYEDWDFWIQLAQLGGRFIKVDEPLYLYRMHGTNYSHAARQEDAASKARLVLANAGFYPSWTVAWAKCVSRGEPGADPMGRGVIPILPEHAARRQAL